MRTWKIFFVLFRSDKRNEVGITTLIHLVIWYIHDKLKERMTNTITQITPENPSGIIRPLSSSWRCLFARNWLEINWKSYIDDGFSFHFCVSAIDAEQSYQVTEFYALEILVACYSRSVLNVELPETFLKLFYISRILFPPTAYLK